jgi:hypothetical protein
MSDPSTPNENEAVQAPAAEEPELFPAVASVVLSVILFALSLLALNEALGWPRRARGVPLIVLTPVIPIMAIVVGREIRSLVLVLRQRKDHQERPAETTAETRPEADADPQQGTEFTPFLWLGVFAGLLVTLGALIGLTAFSVLFLKVRGESWRLSIVYALVAPAVLYFLFTVLLGVRTYQGWLGFF